MGSYLIEYIQREVAIAATSSSTGLDDSKCGNIKNDDTRMGNASRNAMMDYVQFSMAGCRVDWTVQGETVMETSSTTCSDATTSTTETDSVQIRAVRCVVV